MNPDLKYGMITHTPHTSFRTLCQHKRQTNYYPDFTTMIDVGWRINFFLMEVQKISKIKIEFHSSQLRPKVVFIQWEIFNHKSLISSATYSLTLKKKKHKPSCVLFIRLTNSIWPNYRPYITLSHKIFHQTCSQFFFFMSLLNSSKKITSLVKAWPSFQ